MTRWAALLTAGLLAGCGAAAHHHSHSITGSPTTVPQVQIPNVVPTGPPTGRPAPAADVTVIRGWADALRRGNVAEAARYFALPSEMVNSTGTGGALVLQIRTAAEAVAAQKTLPCGARLLSTKRHGGYVNALFALTGRPGPGGSNCAGGAGTSARTDFLIAGGRIVKWIRAPSEPGDPGSSPEPASPTPNTSA
jgi:hypothetical protein